MGLELHLKTVSRYSRRKTKIAIRPKLDPEKKHSKPKFPRVQKFANFIHVLKNKDIYLQYLEKTTAPKEMHQTLQGPSKDIKPLKNGTRMNSPKESEIFTGGCFPLRQTTKGQCLKKPGALKKYMSLTFLLLRASIFKSF